MKIIITENQELDVKKSFIFMLLNNKNYNLVEIKDRIYFVKNIGDEYAEIRFDKDDACYISYDLISFLSSMTGSFLSSMTGFQESEVQELIVKWVEHTLQRKASYYEPVYIVDGPTLNIPLQLSYLYV
jgi:hypothetical protein